jgi:hypothetical protein
MVGCLVARAGVDVVVLEKHPCLGRNRAGAHNAINGGISIVGDPINRVSY